MAFNQTLTAHPVIKPINSMDSREFSSFLSTSLFEKINEAREVSNIPKIAYYDWSAEKGIEDFVTWQKQTDQELEECLQKQQFIYKCQSIIRLSKKFKPALDNQGIYKNFLSLVEENSINKSMPLLDSNNCFTHVGLFCKYDPNDNSYWIICALSQKFACVENVALCKDGFVVEGSLLSMNCFWYGVKVMKNEKSGSDLGPKNIKMNGNSLKFYITLSKWEFKDLFMRKIYLFIMNTNDISQIPYGNPSADGMFVKWEMWELVLVHPVNFKMAKDFTKSIMEEYINNRENGNNMNMHSGFDNKTGSNSWNNPLNMSLLNKPDLKSQASKISSWQQRLGQKRPTSSVAPIVMNNTLASHNSILNNTNTSNQLNTFNNTNNRNGNNNSWDNVLILTPAGKQSNTGNLNNNNFMSSNKNPAFVNNGLQTIKEESNAKTLNLTSNNNNTHYNIPISPFEIAKTSQNMTSNNMSGPGGLTSNINSIQINNANQTPFGQMPFSINEQQLNTFNNQQQHLQNCNTGIPVHHMQNSISNPFINHNTVSNINCAYPNSNSSSNLNNNNINNSNVFSNFQSNWTRNQTALNNNNNQYPFNTLQNMNQNTSMVTNNMINQNNQQVNQDLRPTLPQQWTTPSKSVSYWQIIPNNINYNSWIDIEGVGAQYVCNIIQKQISFSCDPHYLINLSQLCSGKTQTYSAKVQTRDEFIILLDEISRKHPSTKEAYAKFIHWNWRLIIEEDCFTRKGNQPKLQKHSTNHTNNNNYCPSKESRQSLKNENNNININYTNANKCRYLRNTNSKPDDDRNNNNNNNINNSEEIESYLWKNSFWIGGNEDSKRTKMSIEHKNISSVNRPITYKEKLFHDIKIKFLTPQEREREYNPNQSYIELYKTKLSCDIIITWKNEEIFAHKIVLISQSPVFKEMITKNEPKNKKICNEIIKIVLPDSINLKTFNEVIKWIYCGSVNEELNLEIFREMLTIAEKLQIAAWQKIWIVKYIIPNLSKEFAVIFLKDIYKKNASAETKDVWNLWIHFSINCVAVNSASLIKTHNKTFLSMDLELLLKVVEYSVFYLVEEIHLSTLIKLLIDKGYVSDIFSLWEKQGHAFKTCRNFNIQNINIDKLLAERGQVIYNNVYNLEAFDTALINEESINSEINWNIYDGSTVRSKDQIIAWGNSSLTFNNNSQSKEENELVSGNNDDTSNNNIHKNINYSDRNNIKFFSSNSPKVNTAPNIDIRKNKPPTFEFSLEIKQDSNNNNINHQLPIQPISIFSECFNTKSRAWSLKIDINSIGDVSFYWVERGAQWFIPTSKHYNTSHSPSNIYNNSNGYSSTPYSLTFTSAWFYFVINDISFDKTGVIFFPFSNNQHQIIGYNNFFNIKQLGNKSRLSFSIWIKEFPLQSACLQHINDNFQPLLLDIQSKSGLTETIWNNNIKKNIEIDPSDITAWLYNNNLRVDKEENILTALYCYFLNKKPQDVDTIINGIRWEFISFRKICTLARDHENIKNCPSFKYVFIQEFTERIKLKNEKNKHKNECRLIGNKRGERRKYYTSTLWDDNTVFNSDIEREIVSFFLDKEHHGPYKEKIQMLLQLIDKDKKEYKEKEEIWKRQNEELKLEIQKLNDNIKRKQKLASFANNPVGNIQPLQQKETRGIELITRTIKNASLNNCSIF